MHEAGGDVGPLCSLSIMSTDLLAYVRSHLINRNNRAAITIRSSMLSVVLNAVFFTYTSIVKCVFHLVGTWASGRTRGSVVTSAIVRSATILVLPSQSLQSLLLRVRVDVGANDKADDVEEWHPNLVREECLGKGERDWRGDP